MGKGQIMYRLALGAFAGFALLMGCLNADVKQCLNGAVCPASLACTNVPLESGEQLCGQPQNVKECEGKANFDQCTFQEAFPGACIANQCVACSVEVTGCDAAGWNLMTSNTSVRLRGLWVPRLGEAYAVGDDRTIVSYNGLVWAPSTVEGTSLASNAALVGVYGDANALFVISNDGKVLLGQLAAGDFSWTESLTQSGLLAIGGSSPTDVVVVGLGGALLQYDGTAWTAPTILDTMGMPTTIAAPLRGVWVVDSQTAWAVGVQGIVLRRQSGVWRVSRVNAVGERTLNDVWGTADEAYAASDYSGSGMFPRMLHFDAGGWVQVPDADLPMGTQFNLVSVWGQDGHAFALPGSNLARKVIHMRPTGSLWVGDIVTTNQVLNVIRGSSASNVIFVGDEGTIGRYIGD